MKGSRTGENNRMADSAAMNARLNQFRRETNFDMNFCIDVICHKSHSYFFYGDLEKNIYLLSDNMCEKFGFQVVMSDLIPAWSQIIYSDGERQLFLNNIQELYDQKVDAHDMRYRVRDYKGNIVWVHSHIGIKRSEFDERPLALVGYISKQDDFLIIDPVTNFPFAAYLYSYLDQVRESKQEIIGIGIRFNHVSEINANRGRKFADDMFGAICTQLSNIFNSKIKFFRLDGPRILALLDSKYEEEVEMIINQMRMLISLEYEINDMKMLQACQFSVLKTDFSSPGYIENIIYLLKKHNDLPDQDYVEEYMQSTLRQRLSHNKTKSDLLLAIGNDVMNDMHNFRMIIQPVVSAKDGSVLGGETLLRWKYKGKEVSPADFIPILEGESLIQAAGRWVFVHALRFVKEILPTNPEFYLTVNVSLLQLYDETFISFVQDMLERYEVPGTAIVFELTESCMDRNPDIVEKFIERCDHMGIRIALDDFGSGFSSLRVLLQYHTKIIKLDRTLLLEMEQSKDKLNFVSTIVQACQSMGKKVCVEGVETEVQNSIAKVANCDIIQGYYYYRPMELDDVMKLALKGSDFSE